MRKNTKIQWAGILFLLGLWFAVSIYNYSQSKECAAQGKKWTRVGCVQP